NLADKVPVNDILIDACSEPLTIQVVAAPAATFTWSGPGVPAGTTGSTLTVPNAPQGDQQLSFHAEQPGFCALDSTFTVTVDNTRVPLLTQSSACGDQVTITASPSGSFLYRWYRRSEERRVGKEREST